MFRVARLYHARPPSSPPSALPVEGIGILIAVDVIPDTFATTLNVTGDLVAAVLVARLERHEQGEIARL